MTANVQGAQHIDILEEYRNVKIMEDAIHSVQNPMARDAKCVVHKGCTKYGKKKIHANYLRNTTSFMKEGGP